MKEFRYAEEQIAFGLRQADAGTPFVDVCRQIGISMTCPLQRYQGRVRKVQG